MILDGMSEDEVKIMSVRMCEYYWMVVTLKSIVVLLVKIKSY